MLKNFKKLNKPFADLVAKASSYSGFFDDLKQRWFTDYANMADVEKKFFDSIVVPAVKNWVPDRRKILVDPSSLPLWYCGFLKPIRAA